MVPLADADVEPITENDGFDKRTKAPTPIESFTLPPAPPLDLDVDLVTRQEFEVWRAAKSAEIAARDAEVTRSANEWRKRALELARRQATDTVNADLARLRRYDAYLEALAPEDRWLVEEGLGDQRTMKELFALLRQPRRTPR